MPRRHDLTGQVFGRLTVVAFAAPKPTRWRCRCACGAERSFEAGNLVSGASRSCGCLKIEQTKERFRTHGEAGFKRQSPSYRIWSGILTRVRGTSKSGHASYVDRGIDVDPRWLKFENFIADMGERPSRAHSLDRRDNDRGYWPDNCRWATAKEQARNRRSTRFFEHDGVRASIAEWAERTGLTTGCIISRLNSGKTGADVVASVAPARMRRAA